MTDTSQDPTETSIDFRTRQYIENERGDIAEIHWAEMKREGHGWSVPVRAEFTADDLDLDDFAEHYGEGSPGWYVGNMTIEFLGREETLDYYVGDWTREVVVGRRDSGVRVDEVRADGRLLIHVPSGYTGQKAASNWCRNKHGQILVTHADLYSIERRMK